MKNEIASGLKAANSCIKSVRTNLFYNLERMLPKGEIIFTDTAPNITIEEDDVRLQAKSTTKDVVTLMDDTTLDIGDVGTDDLHNLVESVYNEKFNK